MSTDFFATRDPMDDDYNGFDQDTGRCGLGKFADALQTFCMYSKLKSVTDVAAAFGVPPQVIIDAIEDHPWMYLQGGSDDYSKLFIEHDGE